MTLTAPSRNPCPPGACDCQLDRLDDLPGIDLRVLKLTRPEEKRLLDRLENLKDLPDLERMQQRIYEQLGVRIHIAPGFTEVRSMRGINIQVEPLPGLCRKTRQSIPAAIRRGLERNPEIAYALLNANDLLRDA